MPTAASAASSPAADIAVSSWNCLSVCGSPLVKERAHVASAVSLLSNNLAPTLSVGLGSGGGCSSACIFASAAVASAGDIAWISGVNIGTGAPGSSAISVSLHYLIVAAFFQR